MAPLANSRHEAFARALFERPNTGLSQGECYTQAGYKARGHSAEELGSRLSRAESIRVRVAELQAVIAKEKVITIESICAELDEANQVAKANGQAAAMVSASTLRAKLAGLLRDKVEVTTLNPYSKCNSPAELAEALLREHGLVPTQLQIKQAEAMMAAHAADWDALVKGRPPITIDATPINGSRRLKRLKNA
jgi:hypothetical protein